MGIVPIRLVAMRPAVWATAGYHPLPRLAALEAISILGLQAAVQLMDGGGQDELGLLSDSSEDPSQRSSRRHFSGKVDSASVEDVPIGGAASPDDSAGARATASTMDGSVHWSSETHAEDLHNIGTTAAVGANNPWGRDRDSRCHPTDGVNIVEERVNS
jgi:hypothetical protein